MEAECRQSDDESENAGDNCSDTDPEPRGDPPKYEEKHGSVSSGTYEHHVAENYLPAITGNNIKARTDGSPQDDEKDDSL